MTTGISDRIDEITVAAVELMKADDPDIAALSPARMAATVRDTRYHLETLDAAVSSSEPVLFDDYVRWCTVLFRSIPLPMRWLEESLDCVARALDTTLGAEDAGMAVGYITGALARIPRSEISITSYIGAKGVAGAVLAAYLDAILSGDRHRATRAIQDAVTDGLPLDTVYLDVLQRAQYEIGIMWQTSRATVAQEHFCTSVTRDLMALIGPESGDGDSRGRIAVTASIDGDLHDVGITMIDHLLRLDGWTTYSTGASTPDGDIVSAVESTGAHVVAISAALSDQVPAVTRVIRRLRVTPATADARIMVGGRPFNCAPDLWRKVGADAMADDAVRAVEVARGLCPAEPGR